MPKKAEPDSPEALRRAIEELITDSGLSQAEVSRRLDFRSPSSLNRRLNSGKPPFTHDEVERICNMFVKDSQQRAEILRLCGTKVVVLYEQRPQAIAYFRRGQIAEMALNQRQLGEYLYEWKRVHTLVQNAAFRLGYAEAKLYSRPLPEEELKNVTEHWLSNCEKSLREAARLLKRDLKRVNDGIVKNYCNNFSENSVVLIKLMEAAPGDLNAHLQIQNALGDLRDTLDEILLVADLNITEIAEILQGVMNV